AFELKIKKAAVQSALYSLDAPHRTQGIAVLAERKEVARQMRDKRRPGRGEAHDSPDRARGRITHDDLHLEPAKGARGADMNALLPTRLDCLGLVASRQWRSAQRKAALSFSAHDQPPRLARPADFGLVTVDRKRRDCAPFRLTQGRAGCQESRRQDRGFKISPGDRRSSSHGLKISD